MAGGARRHPRCGQKSPGAEGDEHSEDRPGGYGRHRIGRRNRDIDAVQPGVVLGHVALQQVDGGGDADVALQRVVDRGVQRHSEWVVSSGQ